MFRYLKYRGLLKTLERAAYMTETSVESLLATAVGAAMMMRQFESEQMLAGLDAEQEPVVGFQPRGYL